MNRNKLALSLSWLIIGIATLSAPSFAADTPGNKPSSLESISKPDTHDMKDHCDPQKDGMACCDHKGDHMSGMKCDLKEGMKCDHEKGMKCDHMGGTMGDPKAGAMCDHKGG